jgi:hypothetical protein
LARGFADSSAIVPMTAGPTGSGNSEFRDGHIAQGVIQATAQNPPFVFARSP